MKPLITVITITFYIQVSNCQTGSFDYFGQTPPGDSSVVFAPGLISLKGRLEGSIAFSPSVNELCLSVIPNINSENTALCPGCVILYSKKTGSTWSKLDTAYFVPKSSFNPIFSPDGQLVTFTIQGGDNGWGNIYYCNRTDTGWSQPQSFPKVINSERREAGHALTMNRTLYFESGRNYDVSMGDVYRAKCINGDYTSVEYVPNLSTPKDEDGVWVSPDESYAIVESWQDANQKDLYISFLKKDSSWTKLKNMGSKINTPSQEGRGNISPDGKYLFFSSDRSGNLEIYWIRVDKIINDLKKASFAPILNRQIPDINIKIDSAFNYVIPSETFSCEYGTETLKYDVTHSNRSTSSSWLNFNSGTKMLSGTPTKREIDTIKITVTNSDTVSVSCTFKITVSSKTSVNLIEKKY